MEFKDRLKKLRKEKGLTQRQLAEKTGLSYSAIQKYELGYNNPTKENLIKLSNILDISVTELTGNKELIKIEVERIKNLKQNYFLIPEDILKTTNNLLRFFNSLYLDKFIFDSNSKTRKFKLLQSFLTIQIEELLNNLNNLLEYKEEQKQNEIKEKLANNINEISKGIIDLNEVLNS